MKMRNTLAYCVALALAGTQYAVADEGNSNIFSVSGYGTLGIVHSSENKAEFIPQTGPTKGVGYSDSTSATPDSRIGLQVNAKFTDKISGVVQLVSESDEDNNYDPRLVIANVKYQFTPSFNVTLGRFVGPLYMLTDYQRIGYAFPWVRPPAEVYNLAFSTDGVIGAYKFNTGDVAFTTQLFYSHSSTKTFEVSGLLGFTAQADYGSSTFRFARASSSLTIKNAALDAAFGYYPPILSPLANQWAVRGDSTTFTGIGYAYDPGKWFVRAEATRLTGEHNILAKSTQMYASAGARFGSLTPYVTLAKVSNDGPLTIGASDPVGVINGVLAGNDASRKSYTLGNRWDFRSNLDFKVEFTHTKNGNGSAGGLTNPQPGFEPGKGYNLASAAIDFVF